MISSSRASASSVRSLLRSASSQQVPIPHARLGSTCTSASVSSTTSSSAASTSQLSLPSSSRCYHSSSTKFSADNRTDSTSNSSPTINVRLTPKAAQDIDHIQAWLRSAFPHFSFPDEIALQMITHESWDHGVSSGHNRRLAFLGRRALKFYLTLFLVRYTNDTSLFADDRMKALLQTPRLGDNVGSLLKLNEVMRWMPAVADGQKGPVETGLYKVRGTTVEALLGAIYHQHGAQVAKGFFSAKILPALNTFTEQEAETIKSAIETESKAGEAILNSLAAGNVDLEEYSSMATESEEAAMEEVQGTVGAAVADGGEANSFRDSNAARSPSSPVATRRRRATPSTTTRMPVEKEASNSQSSEVHSLS